MKNKQKLNMNDPDGFSNRYHDLQRERIVKKQQQMSVSGWRRSREELKQKLAAKIFKSNYRRNQ